MAECVTSFDRLVELVQQRKSVCYGARKVRVPAAVFCNYSFNIVYNMVTNGNVFVYEKGIKK